MVVAPPGEDYPEDSPAAALSVVPASPAVSPAGRSASRLLKYQLQYSNGHEAVRFPPDPKMEPADFLFDAFS
jgi:hypothetical protein